MKIETNISNNYLLCFSEARGIAMNKKRILNSKKNKYLTFFECKFIITIILCIISIFFTILSKKYTYLVLLSIVTLIITTIYIFITLVIICRTYIFRKSHGFNNEILIDKDGITDTSFRGIKMIFSWKKITGIVIGKYTVTILTDTPCYFYFDISNKDKIIKAIEKYGEKKQIIN